MNDQSVPFPQISYVDPDGIEWLLSDLSLSKGYVCSVLDGIDGVPVSLSMLPMVDGTAVPQLYQAQPGTIICAIYLESLNGIEGQADFYKLMDQLTYSFYNRRNQVPVPGWIIMSRPDGTARKIAVYTTAGMPSADKGALQAVYTFTLQTPNPFWEDLEGQDQLFRLASVSAGILPLLPINLKSSTVIGQNTIFNDGGADSYPVWTITGPGTPVIANNTTGKQFSLQSSITTGHVVQIDTRPGYQTCVDVTAGTSIWDQLVFSSLRDLWPLVPGNNNVNMTMSGSSASSSIALSFTRRWLRS